MITLVKSGVVFDAELHTYNLDGWGLCGITGMLSRQLFPNKYDGIPEYILKKAAEKGSQVHGTIELYDSGFEPAEETLELKNYKRIKGEYELITLANEYLVSDNSFFASAIDLVFADKEENIILADIKTTSVLDKEYVKWQLSIYAYLFELQNPKLKVKKLFALWLRGESYEFTEVERIDADIVKSLMNCEIEGRQFDNPLATAKSDVPAQIINAERVVYELEMQIKELTEKRKELSEGLLRIMAENNTKSYKGDYITLSRKSASTKETLDTKKLKEEHPDIYGKYIKKTKVKESLTIKLN